MGVILLLEIYMPRYKFDQTDPQLEKVPKKPTLKVEDFAMSSGAVKINRERGRVAFQFSPVTLWNFVQKARNLPEDVRVTYKEPF